MLEHREALGYTAQMPFTDRGQVMYPRILCVPTAVLAMHCDLRASVSTWSKMSEIWTPRAPARGRQGISVKAGLPQKTYCFPEPNVWRCWAEAEMDA